MLPVDPIGTRVATDPGAAPAYHLLSCAHRATYLDWLARDRPGDDTPIGLVVLFCSGLERRVLLDAAEDPAAQRELPTIAAEVRRLAALFGPDHPSFREYASALLEVLDLLTAPARRPPGAPWPDPPPVTQTSPAAAPLQLRVTLAQCANAALPVPTAWARAWAWYHPTLFPSTPQTRCPQEYTRPAPRAAETQWPRPCCCPVTCWTTTQDRCGR